MRRLRSLLVRLAAPFTRNRCERDLAAEIESHLQLHIDDNLRAGMTPAEARRQALLALGGVEQTKERVRDARGTFLDSIHQDVVFAGRLIRRSPVVTLVAIVSLALGIGASTAMFTVVHGVLIQPLPYPDADRLVLFQRSLQGQPVAEHFAAPSCTDYRMLARSFEAVACLDRMTNIAFNLTLEGQPRRVVAVPVSGDYFAVLGIRPYLGRAFRRDEERPGTRVAILGHRLWREVFGGNSDAVGRNVILDDEPYVVVGILPERFPMFVEGDTDIWIPLDLSASDRNGRNNAYVTVLGRLGRGVAPGQAQAELATIDAALAQEYPATNGNTSARIVGLTDSVVGHARPMLSVLMAAAGLVLLVASFNVATLLMLRVKTREPEFGLRLALGAGRARLVRQLIVENGLLAIAGGAAGLCLALCLTQALIALKPERLPRIEALSPGSASFLFGLAITAFAGLVFGAVPVVQLAARPLVDALRLGSRRTGASAMRPRVRSLFVVAQVSIATVLLAGTALLSATLVNLLRVEPGFRARHVLSFQVHVPDARYPSPDSLIAFRRTLNERLEAIPGVRAAGFASRLPLTGPYNTWGFEILGRPPAQAGEPPLAHFRGVGGHYFRALEIGLVEGRLFDDRDHALAPPVVVISQTLARRNWSDGRAIGAAIRIAGQTWTVVGIVRDTLTDLRTPAPATAYIPFDQYPRRRWSLAHVVSAVGEQTDLANQVRAAVREIDHDLAPYAVERLDDLAAAGTADSRLALLVMTAFAVVATVLALVGIYGVVSFSVATRTHEIGVRMALGAGRGRIVSLFLAGGARLALAGVGCGLALSYATARVMAGILFGVAPTSPLALGAASAVLLASTLVACFIPARHGSRLDPQTALRQD